jgi:hypothetical protein
VDKIKTITEFSSAIQMAAAQLDRPHEDPDGDFSTVARQFERAVKRESDTATIMTNIAEILDVCKREWGESWSVWDQEQRDAISRWLTIFYSIREY